MEEIYLLYELYRNSWLNIFSFSFYLLAFLLFFIFPLVWLFYFLSDKRGEKFRTLRVQFNIFLAIIALSLIIGLGTTYYKTYGDFDKLQTDGKTYIATHSVKFWKKYTFEKDQVKGAYVNYIHILPPRRINGFIFRIVLNDGKVLKSNFFKYPKPLTIYYNEAQAHADSLLTFTGLVGNAPPVSVYPRWLTAKHLFKWMVKLALWGLLSFVVVAIIFGATLFILKR